MVVRVMVRMVLRVMMRGGDEDDGDKDRTHTSP